MSHLNRRLVVSALCCLWLAASGCFQTTLILDEGGASVEAPIQEQEYWFIAGAPLGGGVLALDGLCEHGVARIEQVMKPAGAAVSFVTLRFVGSRQVAVYCATGPSTKAAEEPIPAPERDTFLDTDGPAPWEEQPASIDTDRQE